ncbi:MAG: hypothetical protein KJ630_24090 [Proteobacteria bacterium]|nr:hypothetical protein [Pseudomonadota bacterium]
MKRMLLATTCIMLMFFLFCGCDSNPKGKAVSAGAKMIEPAMIITKEDAKSFTGVDFVDCTVKEQPVVGLKLCVYEKDEAFLQIGLTQSVFMDKKSGNTPESLFLTTKNAFKDAVKIDSVGDDNFLAPPGLHILKDSYYLTVSLGLMSKDKEKLKAVGIKAVENLKKYSAQ